VATKGDGGVATTFAGARLVGFVFLLVLVADLLFGVWQRAVSGIPGRNKIAAIKAKMNFMRILLNSRVKAGARSSRVANEVIKII
jgi:hypothetical protein